ncbi:hypothetical protein ACTXT7_007324 [Hymenolepis weldensis]
MNKEVEIRQLPYLNTKDPLYRIHGFTRSALTRFVFLFDSQDPFLLLCNVRRELLNENNGGELAATRKGKEHCQRFADSLTQTTTMINKNPGKSMRDTLPNIFNCLKEQ